MLRIGHGVVSKYLKHVEESFVTLEQRPMTAVQIANTSLMLSAIFAEYERSGDASHVQTRRTYSAVHAIPIGGHCVVNCTHAAWVGEVVGRQHRGVECWCSEQGRPCLEMENRMVIACNSMLCDRTLRA
jgi:hypothetical protein